MISYIIIIILKFILFSFFILLSLSYFCLSLLPSSLRVIFYKFCQIEYHNVRVYQFLSSSLVTMFFFSICVVVILFCFGFVLELEMLFFFLILFLGTFRFTCFGSFFFSCIYLDEELEFFYKTIS